MIPPEHDDGLSGPLAIVRLGEKQFGKRNILPKRWRDLAVSSETTYEKPLRAQLYSLIGY
jgi:hypothetical protein